MVLDQKSGYFIICIVGWIFFSNSISWLNFPSLLKKLYSILRFWLKKLKLWIFFTCLTHEKTPPNNFFLSEFQYRKYLVFLHKYAKNQGKSLIFFHLSKQKKNNRIALSFYVPSFKKIWFIPKIMTFCNLPSTSKSSSLVPNFLQ